MVTGGTYWALLSLVFIWGPAAGLWVMMSRGIVEEAAPSHMLACVLSIDPLGFMGGAPVGSALPGVIANQAGPNLVLLLPFISLLAVIAWMAFFTLIWNMRPADAYDQGGGLSSSPKTYGAPLSGHTAPS
jgi:hypothetical protein